MQRDEIQKILCAVHELYRDISLDNKSDSENKNDQISDKSVHYKKISQAECLERLPENTQNTTLANRRRELYYFNKKIV